MTFAKASDFSQLVGAYQATAFASQPNPLSLSVKQLHSETNVPEISITKSL
jgi:hypothetical protein